MKTIPIETASALLDNAFFLALSSAGCAVEYHSYGISGDSEEEFLTINWRDDEGCEFEVKFLEGDNQEVVIDGDVMTLISEDGAKESIGLVFAYANLENMQA